MARYTGPITKKSRRLGTDLVGSDKAFERRAYPPACTGGRAQESKYLLQLREAEGTLRVRSPGEAVPPLLREANRRPGKTGENLLQILESRLDNVVYRAGFAQTVARLASSSCTGTSW